MTDDERALGERGVQRALQRLDGDLRDGACPLPALAEASAWLHGLARWHREVLGDTAYAARRNNDPDGRALAGVLYAHTVVDRRAPRMGQAARFGGPGLDAPGIAHLSGALAGRTWRWRSRTALPPPSEATEPVELDDIKSYEQRVAKRPLGDPLHEAARFLTRTLPGELT